MSDAEMRVEHLEAILRDLINGMRAAAEMTEGSVHSRYMEKACDVAEARMRGDRP